MGYSYNRTLNEPTWIDDGIAIVRLLPLLLVFDDDDNDEAYDKDADGDDDNGMATGIADCLHSGH